MKISELENYLRHAPETGAKVSARQHEDVMRAVRLAGQAEKSPVARWTKPAWGAGLATTALLVAYVVQAPQPVPVEPMESPVHTSAVSLSSLADKLRAIPVESTLPEKELELEIQRLKSDLKRFGLKS